MAQAELTPPLVHAIILTWNSGQDIFECLRALLASDYAALCVIVIDNGSTDGTPERVRHDFPQIQVMPNAHNLGFAQANNLAMQAALEQHTDYMFLLNDDALVEPTTLTQLVATAEQDRSVGLAGPAIESYYNPAQVYCGAHFDLETVFPQEALADSTHTSSFDTGYVPGCAVLIRSDAARQVGLLDENYFSYWEDTDLSMRFRRAGYRVVAVPKARVRHKGTLDQSVDKAALATFLYRRNQFLFARKFKSPWARRWFLRYYAWDALTEIHTAITARLPRAKTDAIINGWWAGVTGKYGSEFIAAPGWFRAFVYRTFRILPMLLRPVYTLRAHLPVRSTVRRLIHSTQATLHR